MQLIFLSLFLSLTLEAFSSCEDFSLYVSRLKNPVRGMPVAGVDKHGNNVQGVLTKRVLGKDGKTYFQIVDQWGRKRYLSLDQLSPNSLQNPTGIIADRSRVRVDLPGGETVSGKIISKPDGSMAILTPSGERVIPATDVRGSRISVSEVPHRTGKINLQSDAPSGIGFTDSFSEGTYVSIPDGQNNYIFGQVTEVSSTPAGTPIARVRFKQADGSFIDETFKGKDEIRAVTNSDVARVRYEGADFTGSPTRRPPSAETAVPGNVDDLISAGKSQTGNLGGVNIIKNGREVYGTNFDVVLKTYSGKKEKLEEIVTINRKLALEGKGPKVVDYQIVQKGNNYQLKIVTENLLDVKSQSHIVTAAQGVDTVKINRAIDELGIQGEKSIELKQDIIRDTLEIQLRHDDGHPYNYFTRLVKKDDEIIHEVIAIDNDRALSSIEELKKEYYQYNKDNGVFNTHPDGTPILTRAGELKIGAKGARTGMAQYNFEFNLNRLCKDYGLPKVECQDVIKATDIIPL